MLLEKRGELSFLEAAKIILNNNDNKPMSANEIWDEIVSSGLNNKIAYKETRPADSLYYMLLKSSVYSLNPTAFLISEVGLTSGICKPLLTYARLAKFSPT